jgi:hypothetical protein
VHPDEADGELHVEDSAKTSVHLVQECKWGVANMLGEVSLVQCDHVGHVDD